MKKLLAGFLALLMVITVAPLTAFAKSAEEAITVIEINNINQDLIAGEPVAFTAALSEASAAQMTICREMWTPNFAIIKSIGIAVPDGSIISDPDAEYTNPLPVLGTRYSYCIHLDAKDGYAFSDTYDYDVYIDGQEVYPYEVANTGDMLILELFSRTAVGQIIDSLKVNGANLDLRAGAVPDVTGTLDSAVADKVQLMVHGWEYYEGKDPFSDDDYYIIAGLDEYAEPEEDDYGPDYYYWYNLDEYNKMFPEKNIKEIIAGEQYYYRLMFIVNDPNTCDISDNLSVTVGGKTYTKDNAFIEIYRHAYVSMEPSAEPVSFEDLVETTMAEVMIPITAGESLLNGWVKDGGKWYYYKNGKKATGWLKDGGRWYYLDKTSGAMVTGWKKIDGNWYYFYASGAMALYLQTIDGKKYYFNSSGAMKTGWVLFYEENEYRLFGADGAMLTGWQKVSGKWYYLDPSTGLMKRGWFKDGGKWYFLDASTGAMLANTSKKIGSKTYQFNASGVCTNP